MVVRMRASVQNVYADPEDLWRAISQALPRSLFLHIVQVADGSFSTTIELSHFLKVLARRIHSASHSDVRPYLDCCARKEIQFLRRAVL
ncbi:hypothetical protein OE88DRAFT_1657621 [Heliocybe sulcata]|uniref:Uncharacterized protein n=1 Tax=Heliocybe sulcata TaxID=5364 RepID=A0A5C3N5D7_9AGAM|nr:hypothetical protein OE88DRAFT_1657621 [Heliocybe sulcata]